MTNRPTIAPLRSQPLPCRCCFPPQSHSSHRESHKPPYLALFTVLTQRLPNMSDSQLFYKSYFGSPPANSCTEAGFSSIHQSMDRLSKTGRQICDLIAMIEASAERTEVFAEVCENLEKAIGFSGAVLIPHGPSADVISPTGHLVLNESTKESLAFVTHYAPLDPFYTRWMLTPHNLIKPHATPTLFPSPSSKIPNFSRTSSAPCPPYMSWVVCSRIRGESSPASPCIGQTPIGTLGSEI